MLLLDNDVAYNEGVIEEREQGIGEIEDQIREANEIFKDLAVLVHDQSVTIGAASKPHQFWLFQNHDHDDIYSNLSFSFTLNR